jgi:hypothetical protein
MLVTNKDLMVPARKNGYPPDKQKKATKTVLEQANTIAKDWVEPKS